MIKGVIFDMDGLMFDTERIWATLWKPALATLGLPYQVRHLQPAGCTRRRRTHHLHDGSFGVAQGCRPGDEGKAAPGTAHLMQKNGTDCNAIQRPT